MPPSGGREKLPRPYPELEPSWKVKKLKLKYLSREQNLNDDGDDDDNVIYVLIN